MDVNRKYTKKIKRNRGNKNSTISSSTGVCEYTIYKNSVLNTKRGEEVKKEKKNIPKNLSKTNYFELIFPFRLCL